MARGWEEELPKQGGRIRESRCLTSRSNLQHLKQQRGSLLSLPGSFLTWTDMSKRLNLPCVQAIPSPSLSLASRHIHFFPPSSMIYSPLGTASSVTPALRLLSRLQVGAA